MRPQEVANCIAANESALLAGAADQIDFRVGQLLCRVARIDGEVHYFYRTLYPVEAESARCLAAVAFAAQQEEIRPGKLLPSGAGYKFASKRSASVRDPIAAHDPGRDVA